MTEENDLVRTLNDRVADVRPLVEQDIAAEIDPERGSDMPSAYLVFWDGMSWLYLPIPGEDELRMEVYGFIDGDREFGPTEMILRRQK